MKIWRIIWRYGFGEEQFDILKITEETENPYKHSVAEGTIFLRALDEITAFLEAKKYLAGIENRRIQKHKDSLWLLSERASRNHILNP